MDNNGYNISTNDIPSINTIPDLPKVDLPQNVPDTVTSVQAPASAPVQQPAETNPVQQPATQNVPYGYGYSQNTVPFYSPYYLQKGAVPKRSAGQIVALIFGILITLFFGLAFVILFLGDALSGFSDPSMSFIVHGITGLLVAFGIFLIVLGARKKKTVAVTNAVQQPYTAPVQTTPVAQPYAAPVQTTPVAQPYAAPVQTAPVAQPYAAPVQTAPVAQPYAAPVQTAPVAQPYAAPVQAAPVVSEAAPSPSPVVSEAAPSPVVPESAPVTPGASGDIPVSTPAAYDYAPTQIIGDDAKEVSKKSARKSALIVMAVNLGIWVVILVLLFGFSYWVFPWYLLFITAIGAISAIKTYPKSVSAWLSLVFSVATIVLFFIINFMLIPYFVK